MNPYFFYDTAGRNIIEMYVKPEKIGIYHIPFEKDDKMYIRTLAHQMVKKEKNLREKIVLLEETERKIRI